MSYKFLCPEHGPTYEERCPHCPQPQTSDESKCQLCGEPMPKGEEMFNYHGYSGPCPKPPLAAPKEPYFKTDAEYRTAVDALYKEWRNREPHDAAVDFDEWKVAEIMKLRGKQ